MPLLDICQRVIAQNGFGAQPATIIGNSDSLAAQCLALANLSAQTIGRAHRWCNLKAQSYFVTVANRDYYQILVGHGIIPNSFFQVAATANPDDYGLTSAQDLKLINGNLTTEQWRFLKDHAIAVGNTVNYRLAPQVGTPSPGTAELILDPIPTVSGTYYAYEYHSTSWGFDYNTSQTLGTFSSDSAYAIAFPESLVEMALNWRLRKAKGFDYSEEYNEYKEQLSLAIARDTPAQTLNFGTRSVPVLGSGNFPATIETP